MKFWKAAALLAGTLTAAEAGGTAYFYRRTMIRNNADMKRTMKMAGTDWSQYSDILAERKAFAFAQPHEEVYVTAYDGLKLHATYLPAIKESGDKKRVVICFHGYTSKSLADFIGLTDYYFKRVFKLKVRDVEFEKNTTKKIKRF